ncbi:50S ribosomal protein L13 [Candidatus Desantisbacteria bacterium]|nr:50S ribosomal protein L13 [Candidatus Desantisbacteria bacterium]
MKTYVVKEKDVKKEWFLVDAEGKTLGRLATRVANVLRGKHKAIYTTSMDTGDFIIVVNADKIKITGRKDMQKVYRHHTGHPGGVRETKYKEMKEKFPERIIMEAVKGMVPHNKLGRAMMKKLKIYAGAGHLHTAQLPKTLEV